MRDAGGELAKRGKLLRLHQAVLRGAQVLQRGGQFARASLDAFEQADVLNCNRGLVGKGRDQLDLLVGEGPHLRARQGQHTDRTTLAQHRNGKQRAEIAQSLSLDPWCIPDRTLRREYGSTLLSSKARPVAEPRSARLEYL